jgi:hypothetical protein
VTGVFGKVAVLMGRGAGGWSRGRAKRAGMRPKEGPPDSAAAGGGGKARRAADTQESILPWAVRRLRTGPHQSWTWPERDE